MEEAAHKTITAQVHKSIACIAVGHLQFTVNMAVRRSTRDRLHDLMPPASQEQIDAVMAGAHISPEHMARACKTHALVFDGRRLVRRQMAVTLAMASVLLAVLAYAAFYVSWVWVVAPAARHPQLLAWSITLVVSAASIHWAFWAPQRTAARVEKYLNQEGRLT